MSTNQGDDKVEKQDKSDLFLAFISPLFLYFSSRWKKLAGKTKVWNRLRKKAKIYLWTTVFAVPLTLGFFYISVRMLFSERWIEAIVFYLLALAIQFPITQIYLINILNKALKNLDNGKLDPDLRRRLKKSKLEHEWNYAPSNYQRLFQNEIPPIEAIGVRVNPVEAPISLRKRKSKYSPDEYVKVLKDEYAVFPLSSKSPDHHIVIGQTGSGKTVLLRRMISAALQNGWQVALIDLKGHNADVDSFAKLAKSRNRVKHFPTTNFNFWTGSRRNVAERVISILPPSTNPFYLNRIISGIHSVITRCGAEPPVSVDQLIDRLRSPKNFVSDITDLKFLSAKEHGTSVGDLIANDLLIYLEPIRVMEQSSKSSFSWADDWDLAMFSLNGFEITSLLLANVILNDFANWIFNANYLTRQRPLLLVIDEASALQRLPQVPVLTALMERARSAKVSIVLTSQTYTAFGEQKDEIIHSGSIRWLGLSSLVDVMIEATGTKSVVEAGYQSSEGELTGIVSQREQKEFKIDPEAVRSLPTFFWYVSKEGKTSSVFVPPNE